MVKHTLTILLVSLTYIINCFKIPSRSFMRITPLRFRLALLNKFNTPRYFQISQRLFSSFVANSIDNDKTFQSSGYSIGLRNKSKEVLNGFNEDYSFISQLPLRITVLVDDSIRQELNMRNSERKIKLNLPKRLTDHQLSTRYIREMIENQLPILREKPYVLRYQIPGAMISSKTLGDEDVLQLFKTMSEEDKSVQFTIEPNPPLNFPLPPSDKQFLFNMPDPVESESFSMISFYKFYDIKDPESVAIQMEQEWKRFRAVGRVYVAKEGVNAQMTVPTNVLEQFRLATMASIECFRKEMFINIDHTLSQSDYESTKPFKSLHIRVRDQILADGFENNNSSNDPIISTLDWSKSGKELSPLEWHNALDNPNAIILDCRNTYETDVGIFNKAIPLQTTFFRESWDALDELLADVPKDAPIMTYCTGGIRCVKINAYLEQKLGFTNSSRLKGGIINYTRELEKSAGMKNDSFEFISPHLHRNVDISKFKGTNYVFDERMGARITSDVLTSCETCGKQSDMFLNCYNYDCHVRFIQCEDCRVKYNRCCSMYCKHHYEDRTTKELNEAKEKSEYFKSKRLLRINNSQKNGMMLSRRQTSRIVQNNTKLHRPNSTTVHQDIINRMIDDIPELNLSDSKNPKEQNNSNILSHTSSYDSFINAINEYCERFTTEEPKLLNELREETMKSYPIGASRMISGSLQGQILKTLIQLTQSTQALELGTFTGYGTIAIALGMTVQSNHHKKVYSCDIDQESMKIAQKYVEKGNLSSIVELKTMSAKAMISYAREMKLQFDFVFIDADKRKYEEYLMDLIGYELIPNQEQQIQQSISKIVDDLIPSDLNTEEQIFLYRKTQSSIIRPNTLIIIDNTLWKGLVLHEVNDWKNSAPNPSLYGDEKRMMTLARSIHQFNTFLHHPIVKSMFDTVLLPLRDGLTLLRYRGES